MIKEEYKQMSCSDIGMRCGFQVRAKSGDEIMEHAKIHAAKAQGMKGVWPETEMKIKAAIKTVSVDMSESVPKESILTTRQDFKFK